MFLLGVLVFFFGVWDRLDIASSMESASFCRFLIEWPEYWLMMRDNDCCFNLALREGWKLFYSNC